MGNVLCWEQMYFMFHCRDGHCSSSEDFNWKETRRFVKSCVEEFLSGKDSSKYNDTTASLFGSVLPVHQSTVVIVDDNLPLRSMRHEYYQVARKCNSNKYITVY